MKWWKENSWRMIQMNLSERDFENLSPEKVVEELKKFCATVFLINAGGISASYPTKLTFQRQNPYVKDDILKRLVQLCHDSGIRVIARTDFSKIEKEIFLRYPQWAFRTKEGQIMEYNGYVQTCPNSEYQQEAMFQILKEIFDNIPFDGLFCNMGGFQTRDYDFKDYGFCHCENCRKGFYQKSGYQLPEKENYNDPGYIAYLKYQKQRIKDHRKKIVDFLHSYDRELCFDDEDYARIEASTELYRRLPHWQYHASSNCRLLLGDGSTGIICSDTSVDYMGYALREVAVSPELQKLRMWQNLTNLGSLDYYFMGRIDKKLDSSAFRPIREVFCFHKKNQEYYKGLFSEAEVLLIRQDRWVATEEEKGWIRVLTEIHVPFGEILPEQFEKIELSRYKLLIIPDLPNFSPKFSKKIDRFIEQGGIGFLAGISGLFDEKRGIRKNTALKSMGIKKIKKISEKMESSLFFIPPEEKRLFPDLRDAGVLGADNTYIYYEKIKGEALLRLIPPHPHGPPECCGVFQITENPGIIENSYGKGYMYTIPWKPGNFYSRTGHSNTFWFMKDMLLYLGKAESVAEDLSPMVEISVARQSPGRKMIQLVNTSGCFGVSFFEPLPIYKCKFIIKSKKTPINLRCLRGGSVTWKRKGEKIDITLDYLKDYEAIVIEFEE